MTIDPTAIEAAKHIDQCHLLGPHICDSGSLGQTVARALLDAKAALDDERTLSEARRDLTVELQARAEKAEAELANWQKVHQDTSDEVARQIERANKAEAELEAAYGKARAWQDLHDARVKDLDHVVAELATLREQHRLTEMWGHDNLADAEEAEASLAALRQAVQAVLNNPSYDWEYSAQFVLTELREKAGPHMGAP